MLATVPKTLFDTSNPDGCDGFVANGTPFAWIQDQTSSEMAPMERGSMPIMKRAGFVAILCALGAMVSVVLFTRAVGIDYSVMLAALGLVPTAAAVVGTMLTLTILDEGDPE